MHRLKDIIGKEILQKSNHKHLSTFSICKNSFCPEIEEFFFIKPRGKYLRDLSVKVYDCIDGLSFEEMFAKYSPKLRKTDRIENTIIKNNCKTGHKVI